MFGPDDIIQDFADSVNRPFLQIKIVACFILSAFLSHGIYHIRDVKLRYAYSFITGFLLQVWMYNWDVKHSIFMLLISYAIMKIFKREQQHIIVFVVLFIYQSFIHIEIMIRSYGEWGAEITAFTMNLVCRLISIAMCFRDGSPKVNNDAENDMKLEKLPTFYKMVVYTFNVPSCIASPFYEYKDFEDWMELKGRYEEIPDPKKPGISRFSQAVGYIVLLFILGTWFDLDNLLADNFVTFPWYKKIIHQHGTIVVTRITYYLVWCFVDSGMILSGLAYNETNSQGVEIFNKYQNVKVLEVEFGYYVKKAVYNWNITIQDWMKKYVYLRIVSKGEKPAEYKFFVVFLVSAFWHGFYPSYYFFFFSVGIYLFISGEVKYVYGYYFRSLPTMVKTTLAYFLYNWVNLYLGNSFMMFGPRDLIRHYSNLNWYGHIILLSIFTLSLSPIGARIKRHALKIIKKEKEEAEKTNKKND
mmetsp:Transcript_3030/g.2515  ORF Transcript_3030/g.2515 Transcript_3030/m.2515 type:complete len:471 (-) Transcript_3030:28-1440(-)